MNSAGKVNVDVGRFPNPICTHVFVIPCLPYQWRQEMEEYENTHNITMQDTTNAYNFVD